MLQINNYPTIDCFFWHQHLALLTAVSKEALISNVQCGEIVTAWTPMLLGSR